MADAADLNSAARKGVRVRISAPAPHLQHNLQHRADVCEHGGSGTVLNGSFPLILGRNALSLAAGVALVIAGVIRVLEVRMSGTSARR